MNARIAIAVASIFLAHTNAFATKKRFIVHYKSQKSTLKSNNSKNEVSNSRVVVKAESEEHLRNEFVLGSDSIVAIEEDRLLQAFVEPGDVGSVDTFYASQWHYYDRDGGIEMPSAWDRQLGSSKVIVAVIDTGILPHADLSGRIVQGADIISEASISRDSDGRDSDPTDEGDWVSSTDSCFTGIEKNSSWHGTHVAGTIAANSANGLGVAGVNWNSKILPVRVLGKCGGYISDIADGIRWAAGGSVAGVEKNQNKADVINLSLGGMGSCSRTMQSAIDFARSQGTIVVVAAGNDARNMDYFPYTPVSCRGVIAVGASNRYAHKSYYSNYGDDVDVMAPGGDSSGSVFSTSNDGQTTAQRDSYKGMMGTSMAAPHVAAVASLILSEKPGLFPDQVEDIIVRMTKYHNCSEGCGGGLLDAFSSIVEASVTVPDSTFQGTDPISTYPEDEDTRLTTFEEGGGGMCGSVAFIDSDNNRNPPKGGLGAFILSLFIGLMTLTLNKFKYRRFM